MISELIKSFGKISNPATSEREIRTLQDAIQTVDAQDMMILSDNSEDPIRIGEKEIHIESIPEWLLKQPV